MYYECHVRTKDVNSIQDQILMAKWGENGKLNPSPDTNVANLHPCHDCLVQHINRANHKLHLEKGRYS